MKRNHVVLFAVLLSTGVAATPESLSALLERAWQVAINLNEAKAKLPEEVSAITIKKQGLERLPDELFRYQNLTWLDAGDNMFMNPDELIAGLERLHRLRALFLVRCNISELGAEWARVHDRGTIEFENFGSNRISRIDDRFFQNSSVKVLMLSNNKLEALPRSVASAKGLEAISLNHNLLVDLPDTITQLVRLRILHLMGNRLGPELKGRIPSNLEELTLDYNGLASIPFGIREAKNLKRLSLNGNQITILPDWLRTVRLESLSLRDNQLTSISNVLLEMPMLKELDVTGNPLSDKSTLLKLVAKGIAVNMEPTRKGQSADR
jgi:hypothetical protein